MRCPDCNKFVGLETLDPEVNSLDVEIDNATGACTVNADVRVVRACVDCSTELKDTYFEASAEFDAPVVPGHEHELEIEGEDDATPTESGGGRYKKNMVGFSLDFVVKCSGCDFVHCGTLSDELAASYFDECV